MFQRPHWLAYIQDFTGGDVVVLALYDGNNLAGFFSGVIIKKFGIPILGSPFRGWMTGYMGFNLLPDASRIEAIKCVELFAFRELGCWHLEILDYGLSFEEAESMGYDFRRFETYLTDLRVSKDDIFSGMSSSCRRAYRKSVKENLVVEVAEPEGFASEYYDQVKDVFAKQDMTPTYSLERVEKLIANVHPSGDLLLARVRNPDGKSIATGIYPGFGTFCYFWGNGSWRQYQNARPNEALHLFAMHYWKDRGTDFYDWGGASSYKLKYGVTSHFVPGLKKSRSRSILFARNMAERLYYLPRRFKRQLYVKKVGVPDNVRPGGS
ncbi:MAG: GNAT family N-acetyltransferase [Pseudomonadota bacterium]